VARVAKAPALVGGAAVLPDDRGADGLESLAVPEDEGLALVGDADRADVAGPRIRRAQRPLGCIVDRGPDLVWVVLDPTRARIVLGDLAIALAPDFAVEPDSDRGRAGRAFVER